MVKKKKLNLEKDLFGNKEYEKDTPIEINDSVTLYYSKKITNKKIDNLIVELAQTVTYARENKYTFPENDLDILNYTNYLIFKHFTNIEEAVNTTDYYKNIEVFAKAYDKGWIQKVLSTLPTSEIEKVYDKLGEFVIITNEINELPQEEKEKFFEASKKLGDKMGVYNGETTIQKS